MNNIENLICKIKEDLNNIRDIFDYFIDVYGMPENHKDVDFDELINRVESLKNFNFVKEDKEIKFEESKALNDLVYLFLLDCISSVEEELNSINMRKRNFINIKEKLKKFIKDR